MQVKGFDFVMYPVSDFNKGVAFYRDTLGLPFIDNYGGYWAEFAAGPSTLAINANEKVGDGAVVALAVDDVQAAVDELKTKGVEVVSELEESEVCFQATIKDPDGNQIILHKRKDGTFG